MNKLIITLALCLSSTFLYADSLRCNGKLVSTGDTKAMVIAKCGEPISSEKVSYNKDRQNNKEGFSQTEMVVEELNYSANEGRVFNILIFENGRLTTIESKYN